MKAVTFCGVVLALVSMSDARPTAADPENNNTVTVILSDKELKEISTEIKRIIPFVSVMASQKLMVDEIRFPESAFQVRDGKLARDFSGDSVIVFIYVPIIEMTTYWVDPRTMRKTGGGRTYVFENVAVKLWVDWPAELEVQIIKSALILQMEFGTIKKETRFKGVGPVETLQPGNGSWDYMISRLGQFKPGKSDCNKLAKVLATSVLM